MESTKPPGSPPASKELTVVSAQGRILKQGYGQIKAEHIDTPTYFRLKYRGALIDPKHPVWLQAQEKMRVILQRYNENLVGQGKTSFLVKDMNKDALLILQNKKELLGAANPTVEQMRKEMLTVLKEIKKLYLASIVADPMKAELESKEAKAPVSTATSPFPSQPAAPIQPQSTESKGGERQIELMQRTLATQSALIQKLGAQIETLTDQLAQVSPTSPQNLAVAAQFKRQIAKLSFQRDLETAKTQFLVKSAEAKGRYGDTSNEFEKVSKDFEQEIDSQALKFDLELPALAGKEPFVSEEHDQELEQARNRANQELDQLKAQFNSRFDAIISEVSKNATQISKDQKQKINDAFSQMASHVEKQTAVIKEKFDNIRLPAIGDKIATLSTAIVRLKADRQQAIEELAQVKATNQQEIAKLQLEIDGKKLEITQAQEQLRLLTEENSRLVQEFALERERYEARSLELETTISQLKGEKVVDAEKLRTLQEQLIRARDEWRLKENAHLAKIDQQQQLIATAVAQLQNATKILREDLPAALESIKRLQLNAKGNFEQFQQIVQKYDVEISNLKLQLQQAKESASKQSQAQILLQQELATANDELQALRPLENEAAGNAKKVQQLTARVEGLEQDLRDSALKNQQLLPKIEQQDEELARIKREAEAEASSLRLQFEQQQQTVDVLQVANELLRQQLTAKQTTLEEQIAANQTLQQEIGRLNQRIKGLEEQERTLLDSLKDAVQIRKEDQEKLSAIKNQIVELKNQQRLTLINLARRYGLVFVQLAAVGAQAAQQVETLRVDNRQLEQKIIQFTEQQSANQSQHEANLQVHLATIRELKEKQQGLLDQIVQLQLKNQGLESEKLQLTENFETQKSNYEAQILALQNRIEQLVGEAQGKATEQQSTLIAQLGQQSQEFRNNLQALQEEYEQNLRLKDEQIARQQQEILRLTAELDEIKVKLEQETFAKNQLQDAFKTLQSSSQVVFEQHERDLQAAREKLAQMEAAAASDALARKEQQGVFQDAFTRLSSSVEKQINGLDAKAAEKIAPLEVQVAKIKSTLEKLNLERNSAMKELASARLTHQGKIDELLATIRQKQEALDVATQEIQLLTSQMEQLQREHVHAYEEYGRIIGDLNAKIAEFEQAKVEDAQKHALELQTLQSRLDNLSLEWARKDAQYGDRISQLEQQHATQVVQLNEQITTLQGDLAEARKQIDQLTVQNAQNLEQWNLRAQEYESNITKLQQELSRANEQLNAQLQAASQFQSELARARADLLLLDVFKGKVGEQETKIAELEAKIGELEPKLAEQTSQNQQLNATILQLKDQLEQVQRELELHKGLELQVHQISTQLDLSKGQVTQLTQQLTGIQALLQQQALENQELQKTIGQLQERIRTLEATERELTKRLKNEIGQARADVIALKTQVGLDLAKLIAERDAVINQILVNHQLVVEQLAAARAIAAQVQPLQEKNAELRLQIEQLNVQQQASLQTYNNQLQQLNDGIRLLNVKLEQATSQIAALEQQVHTLESDKQRLQEELLQKEQSHQERTSLLQGQISNLQQQLQALTQEKSAQEADVKQQISHLKQELEGHHSAWQSEKSQLEQQIAIKGRETTELKEEIIKQNKLIDGIKADIKLKGDEINNQRDIFNKTLAVFNKDVGEYKKQLSGEAQKYSLLATELQQTKEQLALAEKERQDAINKADKLAKEYADELEAKNGDLDAKSRKIKEDAEAAVGSIQQLLATTKKELVQKGKEIDQLKGRLANEEIKQETLDELKEKLEALEAAPKKGVLKDYQEIKAERDRLKEEEASVQEDKKRIEQAFFDLGMGLPTDVVDVLQSLVNQKRGLEKLEDELKALSQQNEMSINEKEEFADLQQKYLKLKGESEKLAAALVGKEKDLELLADSNRLLVDEKAKGQKQIQELKKEIAEFQETVKVIQGIFETDNAQVIEEKIYALVAALEEKTTTEELTKEVLVGIFDLNQDLKLPEKWDALLDRLLPAQASAAPEQLPEEQQEGLSKEEEE